MTAKEYWPEGTRREELLPFALEFVALSFVAWVLLDGWQSIIVGVVVPLLLLAWAGLRPLRVIRLEANALLELKGRRSRRIPLANIVSIETNWAPYRSPEISIRTSRNVLKFQYSEAANEFLLDLGEQLSDRQTNIRASKAAAKALGWPDGPRWG